MQEWHIGRKEEGGRNSSEEALTVEILIRMDPGLLRRRPTGRIHARRPPPGLVAPHPLHQQRNRILGSDHTAQIFGRARGRGGRHLDGPVSGHHGRADVDVVRVQVVGDVALRAGPGLERLELGFGLAHVAGEVGEGAEGVCAASGVGVGGVEAFVVFDVDEDGVLAGMAEEVLVLGEELDGWLCD